MSGMRWLFPDAADHERMKTLAGKLKVPPIVARILLNRGISTFEESRTFLRPSLDDLCDPFAMRDMGRAVDRICQAIEGKEKVMVYGDYDVDGVTAVAMLMRFLKTCGVETTFYIPDRLSEGYGISNTGIQQAKQAGVNLIISVDCGIKAFDEVALALDLGIDMIVTDHHETGADLPRALAVLDPKRPDCEYPFKELAGVGVAYKLIQGVSLRLGRQEEDPLEYLDLVALGSTADIVPLWGENRILVKYGLQRITSSNNLGIQALIEMVGLKGKELGTGQVVFILAPRLNAGGRMGDARRGVRLLTTEDLSEAKDLAQVLEEENRKRREIDDRTFEEALEMIDRNIDLDNTWTIVLASSHWHPGVIGIVASRIIERFYRPTILISYDGPVGKGSARSIQGFDLYDALQECKDCLIGFGGHKYAAGLKIERDKLEQFRMCFDRITKKMLTQEQLAPILRIDGEISLSEIDDRLYRLLNLFAPFGPQNMKPIFVSRNVEVVGTPRIVGNNHLKFKVRQNMRIFEAIGFGMGNLLYRIAPGEPNLDMAYVLEKNEWEGNANFQLRIRDLK
ncbi:MAG: single-stranded-DNA-specific exonuclease RecJ [Gemmatimonadota bacterium]|nr:MAG: single-stranded-DNA-specific exonuclease RecJ [Gemmatimonadota bacterium]